MIRTFGAAEKYRQKDWLGSTGNKHVNDEMTWKQKQWAKEFDKFVTKTYRKSSRVLLCPIY